MAHYLVTGAAGFIGAKTSEMLIGHYGELNLSSPPRVTHATTGEEALRMLGSRPFDMVILIFPAWVAFISVIVLVIGSARAYAENTDGGDAHADAP